MECPVSVQDMGSFSLAVIMREEALVLQFKEKNVLIFEDKNGYTLVELPAGIGFAVIGKTLYVMDNERVMAYSPAA